MADTIICISPVKSLSISPVNTKAPFNVADDLPIRSAPTGSLLIFTGPITPVFTPTGLLSIKVTFTAVAKSNPQAPSGGWLEVKGFVSVGVSAAAAAVEGKAAFCVIAGRRFPLVFPFPWVFRRQAVSLCVLDRQEGHHTLAVPHCLFI